MYPKHWTLPHVLPCVGRELECKQIRTSLLTVSLTSLRVWVINGARDFGQFDCMIWQLNEGSAYFHCGFLHDGHTGRGGGASEGLAAIGAQISSACTELSAREQAAMFPSMYSVADWFKRRMDKPKLLVRAPHLRTASARDCSGSGAVPLLRRCRMASAAAGLIRCAANKMPVSASFDVVSAGNGRSDRAH
jgi:hypothetical protein